MKRLFNVLFIICLTTGMAVSAGASITETPVILPPAKDFIQDIETLTINLLLKMIGKAVEEDPDKIRKRFGDDFISFVHGANGQFDESRRELEAIVKCDPFNTLAEPLLKVSEDVLRKRIDSASGRRGTTR
jgi:hypothetical protein